MSPKSIAALPICFVRVTPEASFGKGQMTQITTKLRHRRAHKLTGWGTAMHVSASLLLTTHGMAAEPNLLKNPGFEETAPALDNPPSWTTTTDSAGKVTVTDREAHGGRHAIAIPAHTSVEQKVDSVLPGAYLARCWVKSESEQSITFLLANSDRPWAGYNCDEIKVPKIGRAHV